MTQLVKLPDSELDIMQVIWDNGPPVPTKVVKEGLKKRLSKELNISTVQTLLNRLIQKDFIHAEKIGKEKCYTPKVRREEYQSYEAGRFLNRVFGNSFTDLASALVKDKKISKQDIAELSAWFDAELKENEID